MADKAAMLRETIEAFSDLRAMLDALTDEQASRIRLGVLGVRDLVMQSHSPAMQCACGGQISRAANGIQHARVFWAPGSFWGLRYPCAPDGA
jgi:hypothetical protein